MVEIFLTFKAKERGQKDCPCRLEYTGIIQKSLQLVKEMEDIFHNRAYFRDRERNKNLIKMKEINW